MLRSKQYESLDIYTKSLRDSGMNSNQALRELGKRYADGKPRHQQNASVQRVYFGVEPQHERERQRQQFFFEARYAVQSEKPKSKKQRDSKGRFVKVHSDTKHARHAEVQRRYRERKKVASRVNKSRPSQVKKDA